MDLAFYAGVLECHDYKLELDKYNEKWLISGQCEDGVPCEQSCFNLHDTMYECYCHEGFFLHSDGYNCIGKSSPVLS